MDVRLLLSSTGCFAAGGMSRYVGMQNEAYLGAHNSSLSEDISRLSRKRAVWLARGAFPRACPYDAATVASAMVERHGVRLVWEAIHPTAGSAIGTRADCIRLVAAWLMNQKFDEPRIV